MDNILEFNIIIKSVGKDMDKDRKKDIKEKLHEGAEKGKKNLKKAIAVGVAAAVLVVGSIAVIDHNPAEKAADPEILNPDPVVLVLDEPDMNIEEDSQTDQDNEKKRGIFAYIKAALYAFFAGIAGFFATKIPWKKIFTKRNLWILLILVAVFLFAKYLLPLFADVPWGK